MIVFKSVEWKNFLSTGNSANKVLLDKSQTTLIIGKNGEGKSTILDALCFGLFGKPFRNINKGQLVNSINNKNCLVTIEFDIKLIIRQLLSKLSLKQNQTALKDLLIKSEQMRYQLASRKITSTQFRLRSKLLENKLAVKLKSMLKSSKPKTSEVNSTPNSSTAKPIPNSSMKTMYVHRARKVSLRITNRKLLMTSIPRFWKLMARQKNSIRF
jgi:AAA15 family ATPase/GTPase